MKMMKTLIAGAFAVGLSTAVVGTASAETIVMKLKCGEVEIKPFMALAPNHVNRIASLAKKGFYNGIIFHRVIAGFMAQTGDPTGTGRGGSKLPDLKAEFNRAPFDRGIVGMARSSSPDSANSQFFIMLAAGHFLNEKYTAFGKVTKGMSCIDKINKGEPPRNPDKILKMYVKN